MNGSIGAKFGKLTVVGKAPDVYNSIGYATHRWYCDCECGTKNFIVRDSNLPKTKSCGCSRYTNYVGKRFGRLTVLAEVGRTAQGCKIYSCKCDCGNLCELPTWSLTDGTKSCGCYAKEVASMRLMRNNRFDLSHEYGIGYTSADQPFYCDKEDYERIKNYCWFITSEGYVSAKIKGSQQHILMHQLLLGQYVDHIGGVKSRNDNRKCNLRQFDDKYSFDSYNQMNKSKQKNNTSGTTGVYWHKKHHNYEARITVGKVVHHLGCFDNYEDAVAARKAAEDKYFGEASYNNSQRIYETIKIKES